MIEEKTAVHNRTLAELIDEYKNDHISGYSRMRYATRVNHEHILRRMTEAFGHMPLAEIRSRAMEEMYQHWSGGGKKVSTAHTFMSKLRTICRYGAGMLEDQECNRIALYLSRRTFMPALQQKESYLTAEQATAIREKCREIGYFSMALAQAFQFDCVLRQKDVIGEWVPLNEPGESKVIRGDWKWVRGITWEEIDENLVLRHVTSKKQKKVVIPLTEAPMVSEELSHVPDWLKGLGGPVIIYEADAFPWKAVKYRQVWRKIADICGIPPEVKNMDSRSGGLTEGSDAGIPLEILRHAAAHSDINTTQRYSRNAEGKTAEALRLRVQHRNRKTKGLLPQH
jgi:integrase